MPTPVHIPNMQCVTVLATQQQVRNNAILKQRGAIRREIHATDGRARCVFLTTAGRRLQRQAAKDAAALLEALWTTIPAEPRGTMLWSLAEVEARFGVGRR